MLFAHNAAPFLHDGHRSGNAGQIQEQIQTMQFKKETYSSKAAEFIRNLIRSGELLPGRPVREALITEKLSISRAPIREGQAEGADLFRLAKQTSGLTYLRKVGM